MDPRCVALLACPETLQPLSLASAELVAETRLRAQEGILRDRAARPVGPSFDALLLREDGRVAYVVAAGVPTLLGEAAIPLSTAADGACRPTVAEEGAPA